jgi:hypothetical protein
MIDRKSLRRPGVPRRRPDASLATYSDPLESPREAIPIARPWSRSKPPYMLLTVPHRAERGLSRLRRRRSMVKFDDDRAEFDAGADEAGARVIPFPLTRSTMPASRTRSSAPI